MNDSANLISLNKFDLILDWTESQKHQKTKRESRKRLLQIANSIIVCYLQFSWMSVNLQNSHSAPSEDRTTATFNSMPPNN